MREALGISGGIAIIVLTVLYFIIKWAVKNGVKEAYEEITGKEIKDDLDEILEREDAEKESRGTKQ